MRCGSRDFSDPPTMRAWARNVTALILQWESTFEIQKNLVFFVCITIKRTENYIQADVLYQSHSFAKAKPKVRLANDFF